MLIQLPALLEYFSLSFKCPTIHTPQNAVHLQPLLLCLLMPLIYLYNLKFTFPYIYIFNSTY